MLYDYNEKKSQFMHLVAISEGKRYEGEFIDLRINRKTVPDGKFMYHCRHDDNGDWVTPVTIEPSVFVNFCGSLITDEEIIFEGDYCRIDIDKYWFE